MRIQGSGHRPVWAMAVIAMLATSCLAGVWWSTAEHELGRALPGVATGMSSPEEYRAFFETQEKLLELGVARGTLFPEDTFGAGFGEASSMGAAFGQPIRPLTVELCDDVRCKVEIHSCDGACTALGAQVVFSTHNGTLTLGTRHLGKSTSDFWLNELQPDVATALDSLLPQMTTDRETLLEQQETIFLSMNDDDRRDAAVRFSISVFRLWWERQGRESASGHS